jgi:leucyl-tRNA---protein transferase
VRAPPERGGLPDGSHQRRAYGALAEGLCLRNKKGVARLLQHVIEPPHPCPYLPEREASLELKVQVDVSPDELETMLERGWRRFGPVYFRPACATCNECVTLRVPTATFTPTKSQRRAAKNAARLRRVVGAPRVDEERLALYRRWHDDRERERGWDESPIDAERYTFDFAFSHPSVREIAFRDPDHDDRLVGLGICDETPNASSAVYFFWDPLHAPPSLGVAHVVSLVHDARARGLAHVYLGYRVSGCASLGYKARYGPHELLSARVDSHQPPDWSLAPPSQAKEG